MSTDTSHPRMVALEQQRRGDPAELARMRDVLRNRFGLRVDTDRLGADECGELLTLHRQATKLEDWEAPGTVHYGLASKLTKDEQRRWRTLVSKACGVVGLLDDLSEDVRIGQKVAELYRRAMTPTPSAMLAPEGAAVIPAAVLEDLHAGRLEGIDVGLLAVYVLTFASGRLSERAQHFAAFDAEGALVVRELPDLMPDGWQQTLDEFGSDSIRRERKQIADRLRTCGWLAIEQSGNEQRVTLGPKFEAPAVH